jgi:hypothetical protein
MDLSLFSFKQKVKKVSGPIFVGDERDSIQIKLGRTLSPMIPPSMMALAFDDIDIENLHTLPNLMGPFNSLSLHYALTGCTRNREIA